MLALVDDDVFANLLQSTLIIRKSAGKEANSIGPKAIFLKTISVRSFKNWSFTVNTLSEMFQDMPMEYFNILSCARSIAVLLEQDWSELEFVPCFHTENLQTSPLVGTSNVLRSTNQRLTNICTNQKYHFFPTGSMLSYIYKVSVCALRHML